MPATLILDYAPAPIATRMWPRYVLLVLSVPAALIPLLDFAWGMSPLDAACIGPLHDFGSCLSGSGFFLAWPIILFQALTLLTTPHRFLRKFFWIIAVLFLSVPAMMSAIFLFKPFLQLPELLIFGADLAIVISAIVLALRLVCRNMPNAAILSLLLGIFIGHTMFFLINCASSSTLSFLSSSNPGYPLTFAITILWSIEFLTLYFIAWRRISPAPHSPNSPMIPTEPPENPHAPHPSVRHA